MQVSENIARAIENFLKDDPSDKERELVNDWYNSFNDEEITIPVEVADLKEQVKQRLKMRLDKTIMADSTPPAIQYIKSRAPLWKKLAVAASILLIAGAGFYIVFTKYNQPSAQLANQSAQKLLPPDKTKATITLADGSVVYLDKTAAGKFAIQGAVNIVKLANGQIAYSGSSSDNLYNTLSNPRGSKAITITLSDGTKVWLNSESSLRYPVSFVGDERRVEITGEAYFEVAHNVASPFTVSRGDVQVQVLGTHFNVNAYEDEGDIKVTLLEGSVNVTNGGSQLKLKPGQQVKVNIGGATTLLKTVNLEQVMAWKNEVFLFKETDIKTVMRQIARWYNVDIEYKGEVTEKFIVDINRNTNVSNVFKILEATGGVRFNIEGRKITVLP